MHNSYAIDSDSPRWWWPHAAAGAVAAAAISVILIVPATGVEGFGETTREAPPAPDPWIGTVDPEMDRPCFLTRAQWNIALDAPHPRCGYSRTVNREQWADTIRPGLGSGP